MSKKLISLLLALFMLLCLSACNTTETNSKPIDSTSKSEDSKNHQTSSDIESSQATEKNESVKEEAPSNVENIKDDDTEKTQSSTTQSKPTPATSQPAHTHSFAAANCTTPKKCSCGVTEGAALGHKYQNGVCSVCNAVDEEKYIEVQVNAANKVFTDYSKYNDALKIIKAALQMYPQNDTLKSKRDYYQSFAPVYLSDIEPYLKTTWFNSLDKDKDIFNTTHYHCIRIDKNSTTANGTYDLSAKYNTFNAMVYGLGDGNSGSLKIYADGACVYSNTSIDPSTRPFKITLDVTGVMDLKIDMMQDYNSYIGECFGLSDIYVQKTVK